LSKKNLNYSELCRRYAKALMSLSSNDLQVSKYLKYFESLIITKENNKEFNDFLTNPLITSKKKIKVIEKISKKLSFDQFFINFLKVVASHGRLYILDGIFKVFKLMIQNKSNETNVEVITTAKLKEKTKIKLSAKLEKITGKKIIINNLIEESIMGGIIVKINSLMIDSSLKTKLDKYQFSTKGTG
jgi:F-type H+-transporting ATPase subunit delta